MPTSVASTQFSVVKACTRRISPSGARSAHELNGAPGRKPGRPPNANKPLVEENTKLARRVAQLEKKLAHAEAIIDIQKKVALLMGETLPTIENDESDS